MRALTISFVLTLALAARAEVSDRGPNGFTVSHTRDVAAQPDAVWKALGTVEKWWDREHTYSGDSKNLSLRPRAGGCFCETLKDGGSIEHARVIYAQPSTTLRLSGGLGPLQPLGVAATLTFELRPEGKLTRVRMTYAVGGHFAGDSAAKLADPVDKVLGGQIDRLKALFDKK
jgi:uncharacterized protein YndB with AHSA1/START domain